MFPTVLLALTLANAGQLGPGDHTRTLTVGGLERSYIVHVPKSYDGAKACPVVLVYHGGGSNAEQMVRFCGLNDKADEAGFIAVYPDGTGLIHRLLTFNGGNCCGYAMRRKIDDVAFTKAVLDDLAKVVRVDEKRIFATGMSNGAIMAYLLAAELSDRIAAIAPVAGPMGTATCGAETPRADHPFSRDRRSVRSLQGRQGKRRFRHRLLFRGTLHPGLGEGQRLPGGANGRATARQRERRHQDRAKDIRRPKQQGRRGARRHRGRRPYLARPTAAGAVPGKEHPERLGQRSDVGVFSRTPARVTEAAKRETTKRISRLPTTCREAHRWDWRRK